MKEDVEQERYAGDNRSLRRMAEDERGSEQTAARGKGGLREKQLIHQQRHSHQSEPALGCAGEGG